MGKVDWQANSKIAAALGIDVTEVLVKSITIVLDVGELPQVIVRYVLQTADGKTVLHPNGEGLEEALAKFELVMIDPGELIDPEADPDGS